MAADENEKTEDKSSDASVLPARVERALERARAAAKADRERKGGRWLALLPASVGVILLVLMMPRATVPELVPLPRVDERVIATVARADDARAAAAEATRLPSDVLAVGSALRELNGLEARGGDEVAMIDGRRKLDGAIQDLGRRGDRASLTGDLLALRALQTRRFLDALARWEATAEQTEDLTDLGGAFMERAADAGWVSGRTILLPESARRVAFKTVWNVLASVDSQPEFALTLDEQRALYAFYIQHPHPSESRRLTLESQRLGATTPEACRTVNVDERRQAEAWRADKIKRLAALDPGYPGAYALGVSYYRAGRFDLSAEAFATFLRERPDGPYALRAKNHLKAALVASSAY